MDNIKRDKCESAPTSHDGKISVYRWTGGQGTNQGTI